ncbi:hypothetical protein LEL_08951 [Akanthomyces lecanii RCEF 1005]|uniref:Major facilitator superfamily domain, general substrate transporter n=1 Tax=Akanthomyces lecanii RCEF 1005 TaxID=1081108 RepID=A0A168CRY1_CORDF|nr:hypothetical protein LEL_08951 [Akanthomyces lecanii RCEF 1005]
MAYSLKAPSSVRAKLRLSNPWTQNFISGVILFLTVGIYLAVIGLGAGGGKPSSAHVSTIVYTSIYAVFSVTGFFGGSVMNTIGPKLTMTVKRIDPIASLTPSADLNKFGAMTFPLFIGGLWYYDASGNSWFAILGGIVGGMSAGLLWTVSGFIQFAYAEENDKGVYIAWQLFLLTIGSTVGAAVVFGITFYDTSLSGVPTSVYITFIVIMASATLVRRIVALIIPMAATEMSSALIPTLSAYSFNLRTRSLNSVLFWAVQIPATFLFSIILDNSKFRRRTRGVIALTVSLIIVLASWALTIAVQVKHGLKRGAPSPAWDWMDGEPFVEFVFVILLTGTAYAIDQMMVMWVIASFSNEPRLLARYGGFFKGMLSAGLCVAFGLEAGGVSYLTQTITQATLMVVSFPIMFILVSKCVMDTNYLHEATVIPPAHISGGKEVREGETQDT